MKQRESFSSRLGFLLISAGCAIGLGNVWRFPYITGQYAGAAFVVVYLLFWWWWWAACWWSPGAGKTAWRRSI